MKNATPQTNVYASPSGRLDGMPVLHDILLCDVSGSTRTEGFEPGRTKLDSISGACRTFVSEKRRHRPEDSVAVVAYGSQATVGCAFRNVASHFDEIDRSVAHLDRVFGGGTEMWSGLKAADRLIRRPWFFGALERDTVRIIAYSDGYDQATRRALQLAEKLKSSGVLIETFGVGTHSSDVDESFLREIATVEDGFTHYRFLGDGAAMRDTFSSLATGMLTVED